MYTYDLGLFIPQKCARTFRGLRRQKLKIWLRYTSLIFLNFQNQKSFWKSDDQKYAFGGGVPKVGLINCPSLYVFIFQCFIGHTVTQASYAHIVYNKFDT